MKIVHVTHHYIDGWGYQDNLLPKYQQKCGHNVTVLTENSHLPASCREAILKKGDNYYDGDVKIRKFKSYINTESSGFICTGLYKLLKEEKPQMIFHHGVDSSSLVVCAIYKSLHKGCVLFVDNHVDEVNQSKNKLWLLFNNRIWLPIIVQLLASQVDYFWGVTPLRCEYLQKVFKAPSLKVGLLPFGGDSEVIDSLPNDITNLREKYNIPTSSFVLVTGGKMDASKGTIALLHVLSKLIKRYPNLHLVLFGKADYDVEELAKSIEKTTLIGWCNREDTLSLLKLADIAVWPLLHTTLIDDAVSVGTPLIVKKSGNVSHYESYGNGVYLNIGDEKELEEAILKVLKGSFYKIVKSNSLGIADIYRYENIVRMIDEKVTMSV